jgi:hypothetical protein
MIYYASKRQLGAVSSKQFAYIGCMFRLCTERHLPGTASSVRQFKTPDCQHRLSLINPQFHKDTCQTFNGIISQAMSVSIQNLDIA